MYTYAGCATTFVFKCIWIDELFMDSCIGNINLFNDIYIYIEKTVV